MAIETILQPDLHDGELTCVSLRDPKQLVLSAQHLDGSAVEIRVTELIDLRMNDFREGNGIFDVVLYSGFDCPDKLIDFLCSGDPNWFEKKRQSLRDGDGRLLALTGILSCTLVAHFRGEFSLSADGAVIT